LSIRDKDKHAWLFGGQILGNLLRGNPSKGREERTMNSTIQVSEAQRLQALREYEILDSEDEVAFDELTRLAAFICGTPVTLVTLVDRNRQWFKSRVGFVTRETPRDIAFCAHAIQQDGPFIIPDATQDPRFLNNPLVTDDPHIRFYAGVPLKNPDGFNLGTLCVIDNTPRDLSNEQVEALRILSRQVMAQLELRKQIRLLKLTIQEKKEVEDQLRESRAKLLTLSLSDELTGLHNRRAFNERLDESIRLATRYSWPLSLLLIDADHFKGFNDQFGHQAGDEVLKTLGTKARELFRTTDFPARIGGEEFAVILPNTDVKGARVIASKFCVLMQDLPWEKRKITVSIGAATRGADKEDAFTLISLADRALYQAKAQGRNRICHAEDLPPT
jgi:diguanylate cyclase (GGDEF)-like protein